MNRSTFPPYLGTLRALAPVVFGSMALASLGVFAVRALVPPDALQADSDVVGNYLQTLGSIYAVLLAFVVVVVWGQFNDARSHVEREANELLDFCRTARGFPKEVCGRIHAFVREYVGAVTGPEWRAMAADDTAGFERGWRLLDAVSDDFHRWEPASQVHIALYGEMLARLNGLCDARTSRLSSSQIRIPRALRILLYTGAAFTLGSMYLFSVSSLVIQLLVTASMAGALSHVLYVVEDLDDCFAGHWCVSPDPFLNVTDYLGRVDGAPKPAP
ncbi:DUF4239 domain-containing protein [bacterium]|nr:MAG: DUF4239 domain-containing protein [bacterium]